MRKNFYYHSPNWVSVAVIIILFQTNVLSEDRQIENKLSIFSMKSLPPAFSGEVGGLTEVYFSGSGATNDVVNAMVSQGVQLLNVTDMSIMDSPINNDGFISISKIFPSVTRLRLSTPQMSEETSIELSKKWGHLEYILLIGASVNRPILKGFALAQVKTMHLVISDQSDAKSLPEIAKYSNLKKLTISGSEKLKIISKSEIEFLVSMRALTEVFIVDVAIDELIVNDYLTKIGKKPK